MKYDSTRFKKQLSATKTTGFTLVELLIVIVVIAILSAITVILYDNIATTAYDASLKSDLKGAQEELDVDHATTRTYPATAAQAGGGQGLKASSGNTITYQRQPYGYCLTAENPDASTTFMLRSTDNQIVEGDCSPTVTLLAGSSSQSGYVDGIGSTARFNGEQDIGITVSKKTGDLYVSDFNNDRIRKITPSGVVTTVAGSGNSTCSTGVNNPAATVNIDRPVGLAYDDQNSTLYFMACSGSILYKLTPDGLVSVVAGGGYGKNCVGTSAALKFYWARGLTMGPDGYLYVIGTEMEQICRIDPTTGSGTLFAGSGTAGYADGNGAAAQFNWPWSGAFDADGNLLVKDTRNERIRKITPSGNVTTIAGSGVSGLTDGTGAAASFYYYGPAGMTIDPFGTLYLFESNVLRTVSPTGDVSTFLGWSGDNYDNFPYDVGGYLQAIAFGPDGILYGVTGTSIVKITL